MRARHEASYLQVRRTVLVSALTRLLGFDSNTRQAVDPLALYLYTCSCWGLRRARSLGNLTRRELGAHKQSATKPRSRVNIAWQPQ